MLKISLSLSLSKVEENVSGLIDPVITHVLKILLFPKHISRNHWENEILEWLRRIKRDVTHVKTPTKKVSPKTLEKWILAYASDEELNQIKKLLVRKYGVSTIEINNTKFRENLASIISKFLDSSSIEDILQILVGEGKL